ncbi:hypothetical protein A4A49_62542 [Nicotiana attenuata]|uniref:Uncharacterized protein n=1 Tax=Nicotiana attenuata TaxID=49451 RepID=A0A1J6I5H1_NICAT|nr:hypothetical protein A4A49_62542 [Nicotiana attenuata]
MGNPPITHIYREQNYAAHYLAPQSSSTHAQDYTTTFTQPLNFLLPQLLADQQGTVYTRLVKPSSTTNLFYRHPILENNQPVGQYFENSFCNSVQLATCNVTT